MKRVLDDLGVWLERQIRRHGPLRVAVAPFTALIALGGVGLLALPGWRLAFGIALCAFFLLVIVVLGVRVAEKSHTIDAQKAAVERLGRYFADANPDAFFIETWTEAVSVGERGDTTIEKRISLVVAQPNLSLCWSAVYKVGRTMTQEERDAVVVEVRAFDPAGAVGARYLTSTLWEEPNKLKVLIHLPDPARQGDVVRLWLKWVWPGYYEGLLGGDPEPVEWRARRTVKRLECTMRFAKDAVPGGAFAVTPKGDCAAPTQVIEDGSVELHIAYEDIAAGGVVGFTLDTPGGGSGR
jgi:hypothetical protein